VLGCFLQHRLFFAPALPVYGGAACPISLADQELNSPGFPVEWFVTLLGTLLASVGRYGIRVNAVAPGFTVTELVMVMQEIHLLRSGP
jgi:hypothetical protein